MSTDAMAGLLALGMPGPFELIVIAFIGLLIFGKRLPNVARSIGKSIVEFKRGVRDIKEDVDESSSTADKNRLLDSKPTPSLTSPPSGTQQPAAAKPNQEVVESGE